MATDLSAIIRDGKLQLARALAIEGYGGVEQSLSHLFAVLLGTSRDKAGVVFFRLANARSRNTIFEGLLEKRHGDKFDRHWHGAKDESGKHHAGLFTLIRQLDSRRNEIVHWHIAREVGEGATRELLLPPNFWNLKPNTPSIDVDQLNDFTAKADFVARSITMFVLMTEPEVAITEDQRAPWLRIFEQPVSYPPEDNHPLSTKHAALGSPPPALKT